jgi:hypothetical protein
MLFWIFRDHQKTGVFGDTFGAINSVFAGFAFVAILVTIAIQNERDRNEKVKDRYSQLLAGWQRALDQISKDQLLDYEKSFIYSYLLANEPFAGRRPKLRDEVERAFDCFYESVVGARLGHVFRLMLEVPRVVDASPELSDEEKQSLIHLFRGFLSDPELHLLLYLGLSRFATPNDHELIERYELLDGLTQKPFRDTDPPRVLTAARIAEIVYYPRTWAKWKAWNADRRPNQQHGVFEN